MAGYTDILGKPLAKSDVILAVRYVICRPTITPMLLHRSTHCGIGKSANLLRLLEDAKVLSSKADNGKRSVLLRTEASALNAALRQLRKGKNVSKRI